MLRYRPDEADLLATERKVEALWKAIRRAAETGEWLPQQVEALRLVQPPGDLPRVGRHSPAAARVDRRPDPGLRHVVAAGRRARRWQATSTSSAAQRDVLPVVEAHLDAARARSARSTPSWNRAVTPSPVASTIVTPSRAAVRSARRGSASSSAMAASASPEPR